MDKFLLWTSPVLIRSLYCYGSWSQLFFYMFPLLMLTYTITQSKINHWIFLYCTTYHTHWYPRSTNITTPRTYLHTRYLVAVLFGKPYPRFTHSPRHSCHAWVSAYIVVNFLQCTIRSEIEFASPKSDFQQMETRLRSHFQLRDPFLSNSLGLKHWELGLRADISWRSLCMCMRGTTSEPAYDGWKVSCWFLAAL